MHDFRVAHLAGQIDEPVMSLVTRLCAQLGPFPLVTNTGTNIGFVYVSNELAAMLPEIGTALNEITGIHHWIGCVGMGICGNDGTAPKGGVEYHGRPAIAILRAVASAESFHIISAQPGKIDPLRHMIRPWLQQHHPGFAVVHGDSRCNDLVELLEDVAEVSGCFLVGGVSGFGGRQDISDQLAPLPVHGGVSGVLLGGALEIATGLTQGCTPIGPMRTITTSDHNLVMTLDDQPALQALIHDMGPELAQNFNKIGGSIFAGRIVPKMRDYLVRSLLGIDPQRGFLAISDLVEDGEKLIFCRRDSASAQNDMRRMVEDLRRRAGKPPRAGLYYSCVARGPHQFDANHGEIAIIHEILGDFPLIGFFGNGEIAQNQVFGHTGVLTLFL